MANKLCACFDPCSQFALPRVIPLEKWAHINPPTPSSTCDYYFSFLCSFISIKSATTRVSVLPRGAVLMPIFCPDYKLKNTFNFVYIINFLQGFMTYSEFDVLEQLLWFKTCKLCKGRGSICCLSRASLA